MSPTISTDHWINPSARPTLLTIGIDRGIDQCTCRVFPTICTGRWINPSARPVLVQRSWPLASIVGSISVPYHLHWSSVPYHLHWSLDQSECSSNAPDHWHRSWDRSVYLSSVPYHLHWSLDQSECSSNAPAIGIDHWSLDQSECSSNVSKHWHWSLHVLLLGIVSWDCFLGLLLGIASWDCSLALYPVVYFWNVPICECWRWSLILLGPSLEWMISPRRHQTLGSFLKISLHSYQLKQKRSNYWRQQSTRPICIWNRPTAYIVQTIVNADHIAQYMH